MLNLFGRFWYGPNKFWSHKFGHVWLWIPRVWSLQGWPRWTRKSCLAATVGRIRLPMSEINSNTSLSHVLLLLYIIHLYRPFWCFHEKWPHVAWNIKTFYYVAIVLFPPRDWGRGGERAQLNTYPIIYGLIDKYHLLLQGCGSPRWTRTLAIWLNGSLLEVCEYHF